LAKERRKPFFSENLVFQTRGFPKITQTTKTQAAILPKQNT